MCIATTVRDGVAIGNKGQAGSPAAVREHTMLVVVVREHMRNTAPCFTAQYRVSQKMVHSNYSQDSVKPFNNKRGNHES